MFLQLNVRLHDGNCIAQIGKWKISYARKLLFAPIPGPQILEGLAVNTRTARLRKLSDTARAFVFGKEPLKLLDVSFLKVVTEEYCSFVVRNSCKQSVDPLRFHAQVSHRPQLS